MRVKACTDSGKLRRFRLDQVHLIPKMALWWQCSTGFLSMTRKLVCSATGENECHLKYDLLFGTCTIVSYYIQWWAYWMNRWPLSLSLGQFGGRFEGWNCDVFTVKCRVRQFWERKTDGWRVDLSFGTAIYNQNKTRRIFIFCIEETDDIRLGA